MRIKYTYLLFFSYLFFSKSFSQEHVKLVTKNSQFIAGNTIVLKFRTNKTTTFQLYCSNSYGATLLKPKIENDILNFKIPTHLSNKRGILNWKLITKENVLSGTFKIISKVKPTSMETYIGPPSIEAGGKDFTMFVVIPTDSLDNPLKENTNVTIQHQFLSEEKKEPTLISNLIAYKNIYSPIKSGRIIMSSYALELFSKEYDVNVMPAISTNFEIFSKRNHNYADGNQITTFYTSILKDKNNNVVSDGSFVEFFIKNKKGNILKTNGKTINGVAFAKIIHPEFEDEWSVKAYIIGIAESNTLKIKYKKVIVDFVVQFSKNNRKLKVGPLKSFMNQMIPDGLKVTLSIFKKGKLLDTIVKKSRNGYVDFELDANIYKNEMYDLEISTAGIKQTYNSKKIW